MPNLAAPLFVRPDWYDRANCHGAGAELFYVDRGASVANAIQVCAGCTVRSECLDLALERREPWGVWGGKSVRQRRIIATQRRRVA